MGEVQKYDIDQTDGDFAYMAPCPDGEWVQVESYQALEAENAKLRAELERRVPDGCLIVPIQPSEEMRKRAQDYLAAEGMIVSDWLVHTAYTEMLAAAPSAPKADPVKVQLLEALEAIAAEDYKAPHDATDFAISFEKGLCIGRIKRTASAAIAAARQEVKP